MEIVNEQFLEGFSDAQREAVVWCDGPSLVVAGAGSGKTRVLTHKIAYLLELGYEPWSVLALTFTNKAAREMRERIVRIVGEEKARGLWMGTFHSVFLRILRVEHELIGFSSNFTIYDASDAKSLLKSILKEMDLDDKTYKPSNIMGRISALKNQLITADEYASNGVCFQEDVRARIPKFRDVYMRYAARCRQSDAMDFDDILLYTYKLFETCEDVRRKYVERFRYVLVDEYQDTNVAQHRIVWQITKERQKVCAVGDDSQSIYSFRGANIDNILRFKDIYSGCRLFKLERNYRSTQMIVGAANSLIKKNMMQIDKTVFSENESGEKLEVLEAYSDTEEAVMVSKKIGECRRKWNMDYSDFAILYRTNSQSRTFEENFRKMGIPYKIYGGLSFYQRKEIKDVIAYFRLAINPNDEESFKRVINYPARGIGSTTLAKIVDAANRGNVSLWTVLCNPLAYGLELNRGTQTKLDGFRSLIESFIDLAQRENADVVGNTIVKNSGIITDIYSDSSAESQSRQENVEELLNGLQDFCTTRLEEGVENVMLSDYLSEVSLLTDMDSDKDDEGAKVTLMTIHSAKGLEFPVVFVVGLEENLFPNQMSMNSPREIEEERRLFYVAITRACKHCVLTFAKSRFRFGKMEFANKSRFINDIAPDYLKMNSAGYGSGTVRRNHADDVDLPWKRQQRGGLFGSSESFVRQPVRPSVSPVNVSPTFRKVSTTSNTRPVGNTSASLFDVNVGNVIEHERFGIGTITKLDGVGENQKATVDFRHVGEKQLLLKFAKFKVVER